MSSNDENPAPPDVSIEYARALDFVAAVERVRAVLTSSGHAVSDERTSVDSDVATALADLAEQVARAHGAEAERDSAYDAIGRVAAAVGCPGAPQRWNVEHILSRIAARAATPSATPAREAVPDGPEVGGQPPVGVLVREDHPNDERWPGSTVWLRIARWLPGHGTEYRWLCVHSDAPGNVLEEQTDAESDRLWDFTAMPIVGTIPGSPAALVTAPNTDIDTATADDPVMRVGDPVHVRWLDGAGYHHGRGRLVPTDGESFPVRIELTSPDFRGAMPSTKFAERLPETLGAAPASEAATEGGEALDRQRLGEALDFAWSSWIGDVGHVPDAFTLDSPSATARAAFAGSAFVALAAGRYDVLAATPREQGTAEAAAGDSDSWPRTAYVDDMTVRGYPSGRVKLRGLPGDAPVQIAPAVVAAIVRVAHRCAATPREQGTAAAGTEVEWAAHRAAHGVLSRVLMALGRPDPGDSAIAEGEVLDDLRELVTWAEVDRKTARSLARRVATLEAEMGLPEEGEADGAEDGGPTERRPMRVGRKLGRTLYVQVGGEPSGTDTFVGLMETAALARRVADVMNAANLGDQR